jgi:ATP-dependent DNA helicase RecG
MGPAAGFGAEEALLTQPATALPGIGPKLAERLAERGLDTIEDLVWFVPRRYDDLRRVEPLAAALAQDGEARRVTVAGMVASCRFHRRGRMRWLDVRLVAEAGATDQLIARWFHVHGGMADRFPRGSQVVLSGTPRARAGAVEMTSPDVLAVTTPAGVTRSAPSRILPRYGDVTGVPPATLRKACRAAVECAVGQIVDGVPAAVIESVGLTGLGDALAVLHAPPEDLGEAEVAALDAGTSHWHRRLAFDELFFLALAVARRGRDRRTGAAPPCPARAEDQRRLAAALPFSLTGAQARAIVALAGDLAGSVPMNRLLQGDVGAGKTAVAFAAAHQVARAGLQVAFMAPTEILAEQHAATLRPWCESVGLRCRLLTASTPGGVRASLLALLAAGEIHVVIGTHALLAEGVGFARLGLVIIDEQHRFGVAQRVRLRDKGAGGEQPHLLVMTATPIPRTLALTAYGDLDVTVLDEMPPGRTPAVTTIQPGRRGRDAAYQKVRRALAEGGRAFVVCPLVEPSEEMPWAAATAVAGELAERLAPARVGFCHGRMPQVDRDAVMDSFRSGMLDVLVATTVVEVGVDVPEATIMVVEDAQHFGLAQLHQLRGRVGRGGGRSECVLVTRGDRTAAGAERLAVMAETADGFRIAEEDLRIRGPGEILGARQAGLPKLRFGDLRRHVDLLQEARTEAERLLALDPDLGRPEHAVTRRVLDDRTRDTDVYGAEGG